MMREQERSTEITGCTMARKYAAVPKDRQHRNVPAPPESCRADQRLSNAVCVCVCMCVFRTSVPASFHLDYAAAGVLLSYLYVSYIYLSVCLSLCLCVSYRHTACTAGFFDKDDIDHSFLSARYQMGALSPLPYCHTHSEKEIRRACLTIVCSAEGRRPIGRRD